MGGPCQGWEDLMPDIAEGLRYATEFEGLRLVVESQAGHWQFFVYDVENCEVLETQARTGIDSAKLAALEFAAAYAFGPKHGLRVESIGGDVAVGTNAAIPMTRWSFELSRQSCIPTCRRQVPENSSRRVGALPPVKRSRPLLELKTDRRRRLHAALDFPCVISCFDLRAVNFNTPFSKVAVTLSTLIGSGRSNRRNSVF